MTLDSLLIKLRAAHATLRVENGKVVVQIPRDRLTDEIREAIRQHKTELLDLPRPFITPDGELRTSHFLAPQYHWMPRDELLRELNAPPEMWPSQTGKPYPGLNGAAKNGRHKP